MAKSPPKKVKPPKGLKGEELKEWLRLRAPMSGKGGKKGGSVPAAFKKKGGGSPKGAKGGSGSAKSGKGPSGSKKAKGNPFAKKKK